MLEKQVSLLNKISNKSFAKTKSSQNFTYNELSKILLYKKRKISN